MTEERMSALNGRTVIWISPAGRYSLRTILIDLWTYRELCLFFLWRDVKIRYKQTVLGAAWAIVQPLVSMVIFTVIFGNLARLPSDGIPYPLFSFSALLPWTFFANGLTQSANSLVSSSHLIKKVYFPRLLIPLVAVGSGGLDFLISLAVLGALMAFYGVYPGLMVLWLPMFSLLAMVTALGVGLWLSAINVHYRDVRAALPFLVQAWMFATPVVYPSTLLGEEWKVVFGLNPMVGVIDGFRWALFGTDISVGAILLSVAVALTLLVTGSMYFARTERSFADVV